MRAQISLSNRELENRSLDTASVEQAARLFSQHGALFIKNVFQKDLIQKLRDAFLQEYANRPDDEIRKTCLEVGDKRFMFTIAIRSPFNDPDLYASPLLLPILRTLVGSECILQSVGIVCAYPGSEMQHLHADHPPLFEEAVGLSAFFPPYALHVVVPLVDLNEECGTTALWEGSHRIKSPGDEKRCSAQATDTLQGASFPWPKMGDCYLMDYRLRHRGTPNRSNRPPTGQSCTSYSAAPGFKTVETTPYSPAVVYYIESRRFLIRDSPRPATTYEQKTGGADGVKGA